jgi:hypothetical protein
MKKTVFNVLFLLFSLNILSQIPGPTTNWFFGNRAAITFNSGVPVPILTGQLVTTEGVASISNSSGGLLFYTDGRTVWTSQNLPMPNGNAAMGTSLNGNTSSTQSAIIVERPNTPNRFYIFTSDADVGANGICYSEVNMSLNAGFGDIISTTRNTPLRTPSCEKLCAVRHCNGVDIWVISHDWNSNNFRVWLVTSAGVGGALVSSAGSVISGIIQSAYGQLKSSPDGKKLLMCSYGYQSSGANRVELFDFDNSTGVVSNGQLVSNETGAYGCEFSENGRVIYAATNGGNLIQWNLCAGSLAQIRSSRFLVSSLGPFIGSLQRGPDSKIYVNRNNSSGLSVINLPNVLGAGCTYTNLNVSVANRTTGMGLPNFASFYVQPQFILPPFVINCSNVNFFEPTTNITECSPQNNQYNYLWNFGDGKTSNEKSPTHRYLSPGTYNVSLIITGNCVLVTLNRTIIVPPGNITVSVYTN